MVVATSEPCLASRVMAASFVAPSGDSRTSRVACVSAPASRRGFPPEPPVAPPVPEGPASSPPLCCASFLLGVGSRKLLPPMSDSPEIPPSADDLIRGAVDSLTDGLLIVSPEKKIVFFSARAEELTGLRASEVLGQDCTELDYQTGLDWALLRLGKRKEARKIFAFVLSVSPDNPNAKDGLAVQ